MGNGQTAFLQQELPAVNDEAEDAHRIQRRGLKQPYPVSCAVKESLHMLMTMVSRREMAKMCGAPILMRSLDDVQPCFQEPGEIIGLPSCKTPHMCA